MLRLTSSFIKGIFLVCEGDIKFLSSSDLKKKIVPDRKIGTNKQNPLYKKRKKRGDT